MVEETIEVEVFLPVSGEERVVSVVEEDEAYKMIDGDEGFQYQLMYRMPDYAENPWFELAWTMDRVDGDETRIESDGELVMSCPVCGSERAESFSGEEFEDLASFCGSCGLNVVRDQPTEKGQFTIINYNAQWELE